MDKMAIYDNGMGCLSSDEDRDGDAKPDIRSLLVDDDDSDLRALFFPAWLIGADCAPISFGSVNSPPTSLASLHMEEGGDAEEGVKAEESGYEPEDVTDSRRHAPSPSLAADQKPNVKAEQLVPERKLEAAEAARQEKLLRFRAEYAERRHQLAMGNSDRPAWLPSSFNPYDVDTWVCLDVDDDDNDTQRLNSLGAFHRNDLGGRTQGWFSNPSDPLRLKYGSDGEWGTPRMCIMADNKVNINCRGAGKALAFWLNIEGDYSDQPIATFVRDENFPKNPTPAHKGEGWRAYGSYECLPGFLATADDFNRLTPQKQEIVISQFTSALRARSSHPECAEVIFDDLFLPPSPDNPDKPRPMWQTRHSTSAQDRQDQRNVLREPLQQRGLNIAYNLFLYVHPNAYEVDEATIARRTRSRGGRWESRGGLSEDEDVKPDPTFGAAYPGRAGKAGSREKGGGKKGVAQERGEPTSKKRSAGAEEKPAARKRRQ
ncbi:hypothetical protein JCM11251_005041 [Rhodosporidiobolus azoricus]